jgi:hypothetical protein
MLHIDLPTRAEIERLSEHREAPAVSLYLATTPLSQQAENDGLRLKQLFGEAVKQMEAAGAAKRSIWPMEEAVEEIADDHDFWQEQANSLAVFLTPSSTRTFRLPNKLHDLAEVSDRFHLKPLLRAVTFPHNAYILAISIGAVRLVEVTADLPPHVVSVPNLPKDFNDALGKRSHTASRGAVRSGREASEHGLFARYSRVVDAALRPVLSGHERPLIVAAAEPLASIYRSVSSYPHTAEQVISGSADHTPDHELAEQARGILDAIYAGEVKAIASLYGEREGQGRATSDVAQAARAATYGAVDTLIFDMDEVVHGTIDDDGVVAFADTATAENYGVVDEIAARALRSGARLMAGRKEDIPGGGSLAAILRYAV